MFNRDHPGGLTREEWLALPAERRRDLARRAQCGLLGSYRHCAAKKCRRERACAGDPFACAERLWSAAGKKSKTLRKAYARIGAMAEP